LGAIVKGEYRIFNKEVDERYYNKFMEVKEKYEQVVEARNNLAS
jgi:major membrane immunogen (membrane-anchored lipoprotein)